MKQRRRRGKKWGKGVQGAAVGGVERNSGGGKGGGRGGCRESFEALIS